jgi:hypothetical protein
MSRIYGSNETCKTNGRETDEYLTFMSDILKLNFFNIIIHQKIYLILSKMYLYVSSNIFLYFFAYVYLYILYIISF